MPAIIRRIYLLIVGWLRSSTAVPAVVPLPEREPLAEALAPTPQPVAALVDEEARQKRAERRKLALWRDTIAADANLLLDKFHGLSLAGADRFGIHDMERALAKLDGRDFLFLEHTDTHPGGDEWGCIDPEGIEDEFANAVWPIDFGHVLRGRRATNLDKPEWIFRRLYSIDPRELRGKIRLVPSKVVNFVRVSIGDDGIWDAEECPVGMIGGKWRYLDVGMERQRQSGWGHGTLKCSGRMDDTENRRLTHINVSMLFSMALTARYSWHACMGFGHGPRIMLPTNPKGCLSLFKNREKPEERRREALRHWVHRHFRESGNENLAYVRDHLRGATDFKWHGLDCELRVSDFDLEKNELFRTEAEQWRKNRKHNRVRVRIKR